MPSDLSLTSDESAVSSDAFESFLGSASGIMVVSVGGGRVDCGSVGAG